MRIQDIVLLTYQKCQCMRSNTLSRLQEFVTMLNRQSVVFVYLIYKEFQMSVAFFVLQGFFSVLAVSTKAKIGSWFILYAFYLFGNYENHENMIFTVDFPLSTSTLNFDELLVDFW